ncbi:molybdate ABC transporter substrate-binding protein [Denitromonas ohlonensis]|uniref:Molybdate ABC transporter substrate-binding protein n=2 Tax=Denitromonas TaxID=139331 RepID=A0A557RE75_9RHOO|nr:molybdate ABC transporter substrate-binding protein [Denitromonas ohlonensis]TVO63481.1 molybdate ABC transporter substrate-binding protein [Denitromonas ohlonensis]TVO75358.1 molybdate ABC transporter substrate-binding protein [Denitromonas ohlonensis]
MPKTLRSLCAALLLLIAPFATGGEITVAVASNFIKPIEALAPAFSEATGHRVRLSTGSTGKFYAQIQRGAPFDVFLSADEARPARLEDEGFAVQGSRFIYAIGRLVLWQAETNRDIRPDVLRIADGGRVAVANPVTAPYGTAAAAAIENLGLSATLASRLVQGENIGQTFQFVATGNAAFGFVAWSQVSQNGALIRGSGWLVPADLHPPIRQAATLLSRSKDKPAARDFMVFLKSETARQIIRQHGYDTE